tara:strand:- start:420 stop:608 length:189 start_codon:yes stop_codon:yes gene_type:complete
LNSIFYTLVAVLSLFIFFKLAKVKASNKQLKRDNRINRFGIKKDNGNIIEGKSTEIADDEKK